MEQWLIKGKKADYELIGKQFGIPAILARLAVNRGIRSMTELEQYLSPSVKNMFPPELLKDAEKAVGILINKRNDNKKIRIIGDYDVDGVISVYILYQALKRTGASVDYDIPDRIKDGYGINTTIIQKAYDEGVDTIITCDNGISAIQQVEYAKNLGMTIIITDHHDIVYQEEGGERIYQLPCADAVVNPKQEDCKYPFKGLCGAAVAFKVIDLLFSKLNFHEQETLKYLEYVAIATVCDVMDLVDENRVIVKYGLENIHRTNNLGLKTLIRVNKLEESQIGVYHLGFIIGPCINASGRLESAKTGLRLLLTEDEQEAEKLAKQLKELNEERKEMTRQNFQIALERIESSAMLADKVLLVYLEECHESIAGIIAGRIKEHYNKPAIVLTNSEYGAKGSARSIEEYNMFEELSKCKDLLTKFGGHPMAAGLSLEVENIDKLRMRLNNITSLTEQDLIRKVPFDMVLPFGNADIPLIEDLNRLEPYGKGNRKPLFAIRNVLISKASVFGSNRNVIRLTVYEYNNLQKQHTAMIFGPAETFEEYVRQEFGKEMLNQLYEGTTRDAYFDFIFYPDINEYKGFQNVQFIIQNFRKSTEIA